MYSKIKGKPYQKKYLTNRCFSKDLVITFPMSDEQKLQVKDSIKRYKNEKEKTKNSFEKFQYIIKPGIKDFSKCYSFLLDDKTFVLLPDKSFFKINLDNIQLSHLFQLVKRDKGGLLFRTFKRQLLNNYVWLRLNLVDQKNIFGKLNNDGSMDLMYYNPTGYSHIFHEANISSCSFKGTERFYNDFMYKNKEIEEKIPSLNEWGIVTKVTPLASYVLPSLKEICVSVLKEMFLIDRKSILEIIKNLPKIILNDFINNCMDDEKPVGQEIVFELFKYYSNLKDNCNYSIEELFPLDKLLKSGINREEWFRYNYSKGVPQDLFYPHYNESFAINVYENYNLFKNRKVPADLEHQILFKSKLKDREETIESFDGHSIVDKETFLKNFHRFTNNMFQDLSKIPKGVVFIGGCITYCLSNNADQLEEAYKYSDIDVCYIGNDFGERLSSITAFEENYFGDDRVYCENDNKRTTIYDFEKDEYYKCAYSLTKLGKHISISKHFPYRHVQINTNCYRSIEEVLMGVDIDASCFLFDGQNLFCLERSMLSVNYKMNIASNHSYLVREGPQYQTRLLKYLDRGFDIFYISSEKINEIVNSKFNPSSNKVGFSLLYSAKLSNKVYRSLTETEIIDLNQPYGKEWNQVKYETYIDKTINSLFDGYGSEKSVRNIIESIGEGLYEFESDIYNYKYNTWETDYNPIEIIYAARVEPTDSYNYYQLKKNYLDVLHN
ncbi:hypothetical protein DICPUDRAFT_29548 [Dictyostelium purpureum]|uniref:Uncharacterized protein n=1 Tax=Dictyostelium purpureum TaxID=5786 RepID=F0ZDT4_DICPU|nr:uncharacterized protein DICPUDRAFT_29548 [Dictyostelium purpureum]EGC37904.1 hypothetical protein DICPUDRAFT_29548 [Dictyostelium purpureum]|eukprot:XP_003285564.1 hypothetical protein DICPUDRAFT_29548 [Dictyostelium purpureum]